ncbi:MAG: hypothetical protein HY777_02490 [Betaproteobacteria bacterium]|nr:hypothetical protein [Betaproteobacteria bacterium]
MSDSLRIALVAEGITDYEILDAAVESMLNGRSYILKLLQPEGSIAFTGKGSAGHFGGGWKGVYQWCLQAVQRSGGKLRDDPLFLSYDLLLLHLDADVAGEDPAHSKIDPIPELAGVLPCEQPCPPPTTTTELLRCVFLSWVGEAGIPPRTVICTPSKSTEAWVMAAFFQNDKEMEKKGWECHPKPESRLAQQPVNVRFAKTQADYAALRTDFKAKWPYVVAHLPEARRFQSDFHAAIPPYHE